MNTEVAKLPTTSRIGVFMSKGGDKLRMTQVDPACRYHPTGISLMANNLPNLNALKKTL
jgi:hypothetical protein